MKNYNKFIKTILIILLFFLSVSVNASEFKQIDYKNLKEGSKIYTDGLNWTNKVNKKTDYYIKKIATGANKFSEFYSKDGIFLFSTATQYEFIKNGSLIGYSNLDLKFYEYEIKNNILEQRELTPEEVQDLFPKYEIIKISDFSNSTNSLKIKKKRGDLKLIVLNDTDRYFDNYSFTTNNSKFKPYELKSFLDIEKRGMIQFSKFGDNTKNTPWYIILVR